MAAPHIRMDYDAGKDCASCFTQSAEGIRGLLNSLQRQMDVLSSGAWRGRGADAFYAELKDFVLPSVGRLVAALEEACRCTGTIAERFQAAEREAGALFVGGDEGGIVLASTTKTAQTEPSQQDDAVKRRQDNRRRKYLNLLFREYAANRPDYSHNHRIDYPRDGDLLGIFGRTNLTSEEADLLDKLNPFQRQQAQAIAKEAFKAAENWCEEYNLSCVIEMRNGLPDAFRHAYLSALFTRAFGSDWAKKFTDAHEKQPENNESEFDAEFMDLHNNALGIRIAQNNPTASNEELKRLITEAIRNGEAVYIKQEVVNGERVKLGLELSDMHASASGLSTVRTGYGE